jgi:glycosyltransferase involved in cell wall biosynthesis
MPKRPRVLFLTMYDEKGASSRLVVYQFLPVFEAKGFEVAVHPLITGEVYGKLAALSLSKNPIRLAWALLALGISFRKRLRHVLDSRKFDLVVVQKDVLPFGLGRLLKWLQPNLILTFDDPIWLPHPGGGGDVPLVGPFLFWYRKRLLISLLRASRLAIVDNPRMREFCLPYCPDTRVLNSPVDVSHYSAPSTHGVRLAFGWIGSPNTSYLLERTIPFLEGLAEEFEFELYNLGSSPVSSDKFKIHNLQWSEENELKYLPRFSIGLMPMDQCTFSEFRLSRKWIIYGCAEVPTLASRNSLNPLVIRDGETGFLYGEGDAKEFQERAAALLKDPELRRRMGKAARKLIEENYDLPVVTGTWIGALQDALGDSATGTKRLVPES